LVRLLSAAEPHPTATHIRKIPKEMVVPVRVGLEILLVLLDFPALEHLLRETLVEQVPTPATTVQVVAVVLVLSEVTAQHLLVETAGQV